MKKFLAFMLLACVTICFSGCEKDSDVYGNGGNNNYDYGTGQQPTASFQYSTGASFKVTFTNLSTNALSYKWDFGDGQTSTSTSPTHTYASRGSKYVTLTAYNGSRTSVAYATIVMTSQIKMINTSSNPYFIYIDGVYVATLSGGYYQIFDVNPGTHSVRVIQKSGYTFYATDETYSLTCRAGYQVSREFPDDVLGKSAPIESPIEEIVIK